MEYSIFGKVFVLFLLEICFLLYFLDVILFFYLHLFNTISCTDCTVIYLPVCPCFLKLFEFDCEENKETCLALLNDSLFYPTHHTNIDRDGNGSVWG